MTTKRKARRQFPLVETHSIQKKGETFPTQDAESAAAAGGAVCEVMCWWRLEIGFKEL